MPGHFATEAQALTHQITHEWKLTKNEFLRLRDTLWPEVARLLRASPENFSDYELSRLMQPYRDTARKSYGIHLPETHIPPLPASPDKAKRHNGMVALSTNLTRVFGA